METKTIVLSENEEKLKTGRAILTLSVESGLLKCKLRLYNVPPLNRFCKLGIYHQDEVVSGNLIERNGGYESSMVGDFDMSKDFYCALVDTSKDNLILLTGGTYGGMFFSTNMVEKGLDAFADLDKEIGTANFLGNDDYLSAQQVGHLPSQVEARNKSEELRVKSEEFEDLLNINPSDSVREPPPLTRGGKNADDLGSRCDKPIEMDDINLGSHCEGSWREQSERLRGSQNETTSPRHNTPYCQIADAIVGSSVGCSFPPQCKFLPCGDPDIMRGTSPHKGRQDTDARNDTCCDSCIYKQVFFETQSKSNSSQNETTSQSVCDCQLPSQGEPRTKETTADYLSSIVPQFDYIFSTYPADDTLNALLENSKFVHIDDEHNGYSIGAIYQQDKMQYICYAVRSNYNDTPPAELGNNYQWLPLDSADPLSDGYFVVFQDAHDLKILTF